MILGLILAQGLTVVTLVLLSNRSVDEITSRQISLNLDQESADLADSIPHHLGPAESIVNLSAELATEPGISAPDFTNSFISALEQSPQLAAVFLTQPDGTVVRVSREDFGYRVSTTLDLGSVRTTDVVDLDPLRQVVEPTGERPERYDPTASSWYRMAVATEDQLVWTDPYALPPSSSSSPSLSRPGITAAKAIWGDGELIGVVGADVELRQLSLLIAASADDNVGAVIVNSNHVVVAHHKPDLLFSEESGGARPLTIDDLRDGPAQEAITFASVSVGVDRPAVITYHDPDVGSSRVASRLLDVSDAPWTLAVYGSEEALGRDLQPTRFWTPTKVGILWILAIALVAVPATRAVSELETRALTDPLTGLANRRAVIEAVREDGEGSRLRAVAMIDLDHFKRVNDTYGHPVGDQVLQAIAKRIRGSLRAEATVGRVGGEEFLVTFKPASIDDAYALCERIRLAVASTPISTTAGLIDTTASLGLATTSGPCRDDRLMFSADMALLQAKEDGRNRVVAVELGPNPGPPLLSAMPTNKITDTSNGDTQGAATV